MEIVWSIPQLERKIADGFVYTAHWRCTASGGDYSAEDDKLDRLMERK